MKSVIAASALVALASAAVPKGTIPGVTTYVGRNGDVPLIYNDTPYPDNTYDGTLYGATVIDGVTYNNSNAWPCLTAADYESIIPSCSLDCIKKSLAADDCDEDDFVCHCTADQSAKIDAAVIPCLTTESEVPPCTDAEIGQLANYVHGSLCPYFIDAPYIPKHDECYGQQPSSKPVSSAKPTTSTKPNKPATTSTKGGKGGKDTTSTKGGKDTYGNGGDNGVWGATTTSTSTSSTDAWGKPEKSSSTSSSAAWGKGWSSSADPEWSVSYTTEVVDAWTTYCPEATTFWVGESSWVVTEATTITVDAITWTKPVTATAVWATYSTPAAPVYPAASSWAAGAAAGSSWAAGAAAGAASSSGWAAGAAAGTASYKVSPAQFTGAASNNKVAGAMAAAAAGAAALLI